MLTYFVARKSYSYYKKRQDERKYAEYVVRRSHDALLNPGATMRPLPPLAHLQDGSAVSVQPVKALPTSETPDGPNPSAAAVMISRPPPPPPPPRSSRLALEQAPTATPYPMLHLPGPTSRPPPPIKSTAVSSAGLSAVTGRIKPAPPKKPTALSSKPVVRTAETERSKTPTVHPSQKTRTRPQASPDPEGSQASLDLVPLSAPAIPAPPFLAPRRALLVEMPGNGDSPLKRNKSAGETSRDSRTGTESRTHAFDGSEYTPKLRTSTPPPPPPTLPARARNLHSSRLAE